MKTDLRKKIDDEKINVEQILHRFYKYIDIDTGKEIAPEIIENLPSDDNSINYEIEHDIYCSDYLSINMNSFYIILNKIMAEFKDKYDMFLLESSSHYDSYPSMFVLIGRRLETDEECQDRINKQLEERNKKYQEKEIKRLEKENKKKAKEQELLRQLKQKYDTVN